MTTEKSFAELPASWVWTRLNEISETTSGGTPSRRKKAYFGGNIPWLKSGELNNNVVNSAEETITEDGLTNSSAKIISRGTLLMALYGATVGKLAILGIDAAINQAICAISPCKGVSGEFLFWYLTSYRDELLNIRKGGAQPNISQEIVREIPVPLAPFNEQRRIVARLEELFTRLDAGVEGLRKAKAQLKRYRQAVLKYAFEGKLTEEHRNNSVYDEKLEWAVPADWSLKPAKELFYIKGRIGWRGLKKSHFTTEGPYLITGVDFTDGKIDWEKCYHIPMDKYLESPEIFVQGDDILLTKDGTIGKIAYIDHVPNGQASINAHILLIRNLQNNGIFAKFMYYMLQTQYFFNFVDLRKIGTTRPALTQRAFEEFPVFYPPIEKQKKIVEKIEDCLSIVDHVNMTLERSLTQARELRKLILEKAFGGELVPQDPNDESAEKLLERIREERAKSKGEKDINTKKVKPKQLELSTYVK